MMRAWMMAGVAVVVLPLLAGSNCGPGEECTPQECGPVPGVPTRLCADGSSAGPQACARRQDGACGYTITTCPAPIHCGGIAARPCPDGMSCEDDPSDSCSPDSGGADCGGICKRQVVHCGGIAARPCPGGMECTDDPNDGCDPNAGGADCGGICINVM